MEQHDNNNRNNNKKTTLGKRKMEENTPKQSTPIKDACLYPVHYGKQRSMNKLNFEHDRPSTSKTMGNYDSDRLNESGDLFSEDEMDDFISSLPDSVASGSQPVPGKIYTYIVTEELPDLVMESIFCCLPITDMMLSCPLVCMRWENLIMNEMYMPWKKSYHRVRHMPQLIHDQAKACLVTTDSPTNSEDINDADVKNSDCILKIIRAMPKLMTCSISLEDADRLEVALKRHPLYHLTEDLLSKRVLTESESFQNEGSMWMVCTCLLLLSNPGKLKFLIDLMSEVLPCSHVMDFCYAVALSLWIAYRFQLISQEHHYRLFCVLASIENTSKPLPTSRRTDFPPTNITHEQRRIASHQFKRGQLVRVIAYAGAGKTTTLASCVTSQPDLKFLYTSFSKAVVDLGKNVFSAQYNVKCATLHGMAYRAMGIASCGHKMSRGGIRVHEVRRVLDLSTEETKSGVLIVKTLTSFMASDAQTIALCHTPSRKKVKMNNLWVFVDTEPEERKLVRDRSREYWSKMTDLKDSSCSMTDDCYLKMWQLTMPHIGGYDVILLDEAQDCTNCMRSILELQRHHAALVFVGDSHQQIYGFRLARDALLKVSPSHTYYLTQSFRFGGDIAQVADSILRAYKFQGFALPPNNARNQSPKVADKTLLGVGQPGDVSGLSPPGAAQRALLCRTNRGVIQKTLHFLSKPEMKGKAICIIGGAEKLGLDTMNDIYVLSKNLAERQAKQLRIRSPYIARFASLRELIDEAELQENQEMLNKIEIVKALNDNLPDAIRKLKSLPRDCDNADLVVSTVHKAKGLEFDSVQVCADFSEGLVDVLKNQGPESLPYSLQEEANLLYVAVTRSRRELEMPNTLCQLLRKSRIHFFQATPTSDHFVAGDASSRVTCAVCRQMVVTKSPLTFQQPSIKWMQEQGPLCPRCAAILAPGWGLLLGDGDDITPRLFQESLLHL